MTRFSSFATAVLVVLTVMFVGLSQTFAQGQAVDPSVRPDPSLSADVAADETARDEVSNRLDGIRAQLEQLQAAFQRDELDEETLRELRERLDALSVDTTGAIDAIFPERQRFRALLGELGPAPEGGATEPESVAANRAILNDELTRMEATIGRARLLNAQIEQATARIAERRKELFAEQLSQRSVSPLNPIIWREVLDASPRMLSSLTLFLSDSVSGFLSRLTWSAGLLALGVGVAYFTILRIFRRRLNVLRAQNQDEMTLQARHAAGLLNVIVKGILFPVGIALILGILGELGVFPPRSGDLLRVIVGAVFAIAFVRSISLAFLAPKEPLVRIVPFTDAQSGSVHRMLVAVAGVIALNAIITQIGIITIAPVAFEAATGTVSALLIATVLIIAMRRVAAARETIQATMGETGFIRWSFVRVLLWVAIAIIVLSAITGYSALADFVAHQTVGIMVILALVRLVLNTIQHGVTSTLTTGTPFSRAVHKEVGLSGSTTFQIGLFLAGLARLLVILLAAVFILVPWGFDAGDWLGWFGQVTSGIEVGEVTISPIAILTAVGIFFLGWAAVRAIKRWFEETYLPSTSLDVGLQNSIATGLGYLGIILAALFAISYVGLDLSRLAIIAGALSVGIGFGLQSIVNNFVSGLILLAERPIKAGDWIVVGAEQGTVRKISVRATEIETFDRASVIVPNSDLISTQVKNWTHSSTLGRIILNVGVSYDADPEQVRDILLASARDHDDILAFPEPAVFFMEFGASSLDFSLYAFLADVGSGLRVRSDLRFDVMRRFKEAGIEIPVPQQDLHIRDAKPIVDAVYPPKDNQE
ncbi:MAG: DUF3772 domain-containing protein [Pseudomonadota bacterium]